MELEFNISYPQNNAVRPYCSRRNRIDADLVAQTMTEELRREDLGHHRHGRLGGGIVDRDSPFRSPPIPLPPFKVPSAPKCLRAPRLLADVKPAKRVNGRLTPHGA